MLIDIDHFKAVNDRLGHEAGDQVLRAVANVIQRCRPQDSLAVRLGGEEFALLVPRSTYEQCRPEMVLEAVRTEPMPQGSNVTVSIGYADGSVISEENWKRLYRLADAALYRAKADGRDRSCRATDFRAAA
jgi:diguanylate cyclase (GGDEF)-like protein